MTVAPVPKASVPHVLVRYSPLLILALSWEAASRLHLVSSLALPPLSDVAQAWLELVQSGELVANGLSSLYRAGAGLALAIVVGGALGIFMAISRPVARLWRRLESSADLSWLHAAGHHRRLQWGARQ